MTPEQISAFQAVSLVKPDTVNLVMPGLFSAFLLLWVVWVLNDAYWGVATMRVNWQALGSIGGRTISLPLVSLWLILSQRIPGGIMEKWLFRLLLWFLALPVYADLSEMEDPSRGQGDGIMGTLQNYGYDIVILMTLGICAMGFLVVANNCIATYFEIQGGRKQWKDLGAMVGVGAVLLVIITWLLNQTSSILQAISTISLFPERLNREPVVFRGLTVSELLIALLVGLATGVIAGTILTVLRRNQSPIPGSALPGGALVILCGGRWLARLKRGRPESWLCQALKLRSARFGIGTQRLVLHDGVWAIRRS